jgi:hypothetical protein
LFSFQHIHFLTCSSFMVTSYSNHPLESFALSTCFLAPPFCLLCGLQTLRCFHL